MEWHNWGLSEKISMKNVYQNLIFELNQLKQGALE